jgi:hypothetical protein
MLSTKTGAYASIGLPASQDETGSYLPDAVMTPLLEEAQKVTPEIFKARLAGGADMTGQMPALEDPQISYEKSKELILSALEKFDPALARKAKEIFDAGYDDAGRKNFIEDLSAPSLTESGSRWRLRQVPPGQMHIMRSIEAKSEKTELDPQNPNEKSVIQFEYDGTVNSTVYLAHELGHSMADDFIRDDAGNKFGNNPKHLDEFQAYFIQNIVAEDLKRNADPVLARAAKEHFDATMATNLCQLPLGLAAISAQKNENSGHSEEILKNWFNKDWATYAPAQKAAQDIEKEKIDSKSKYIKTNPQKNIEDNIARLHARPASFLLAASLAARLQDASPDERRKTSETLLGKNGPQNICDVLATAGIRTTADAQNLCRATMERTAQSITQAPAAPLHRPALKTAPQASV